VTRARHLVLGACALACAAGLAATAPAARAEVERYAVIIGHNTGAADEQRLRFAEDDAERVGELLGEVGGVPDENQVVLRGKSADQVRRALIATNERIRVGGRAGRQAMLFVYYSGHGDADALHLGDTRLELRELEALVRGSAAQIRVLAIDACRSGSVTRVKGGRPAPPITLRGDDELTGEGVIILTASTAGEDAQESDDLRGSFFTHYLLSALRGAADDDGDQTVTIGEAFRYTRDQTILASSRTLGGVQHPTFHYDLRGRADIVLVDLGSDRTRGRLTVPADASWLVVRDGGRDAIVGEIGADASRRTLSLRPGRYRVRGRSRDALLEGTAIVARGQETVIAADALTRTTYARLVRKGRGEILPGITGVFAGPAVQSAIIEGASPCVGATVGAAWVRADITLSPRLGACRGEFANETLTATTTALALDLRVAKAWDLHRVTLDVGVTVGGELLRETFTTRGVAPARTAGAIHVDAGVGALLPVAARLFLTTEIAAQTHFFTVEAQAGTRDLTARFALRGVLAFGGWL
jgi:hypothetical protein